VASWIRFLYGTDEQGNEIPINDPQAERLTSIVKKHREDAKPLLALTDIFGNLGKSEKFIKELELLLGMLHEKGAQETLCFCS
jgi:mannitol 2-dehydrogenase